MSLLFGIPILAFLAAVQATLLTHVRVLGGSPDLVLLAVVTWSLVAPDADGMLWAFFGGLTVDSLSGGVFGLNAVALLLITFFAGLAEDRFWRTHFLLPLAAVMIGTLVHHALLLGALAVQGRPVDWGYAVAAITLPTLFLNVVLTIPAYFAANRFRDFVYPPKVEF